MKPITASNAEIVSKLSFVGMLETETESFT
jgi:hypothetical protein